MGTRSYRTPNLKFSVMLAAAVASALALLFALLLHSPNVAAEPASPVTVTVELQGFKWQGNEILGGFDAAYAAGGTWHPITTPNPNNHKMVRAQIAPGTYTFRMVYNGTSQQKQVTIPAQATTVYFHAALVNVELQGFKWTGNEVLGGFDAAYAAGGVWHPITTPNPNNPKMVTAYMLPGTYTFRMTYNGTSQQKSATIVEPNPNNHANAVQSVYFHAATVNVELQGFKWQGNEVLGGFDAAYAASGAWHPITTPNPHNAKMVTAYMLPGTYTFRMGYNGTSQQKQATIVEPNPNNHADAVQSVYFHAATVNVELQGFNSQGNVVLGGFAANYAASGAWHPITTPNPHNSKMVTAYMLPGTYTFRMVYNGTSQQKSATIVEPNPNNHADAVQSVYFHAATVEAVLRDSGGAGLSGGTAQYAAGGAWHAMGTTNDDGVAAAYMLPGTYAFRMSYNNQSQQRAQAIIAPNPNNGANSVQEVGFVYPFN